MTEWSGGLPPPKYGTIIHSRGHVSYIRDPDHRHGNDKPADQLANT